MIEHPLGSTNRKQQIRFCLREAERAAAKYDFGNAWAYVRIAVLVFDAEGFDVTELLPERYKEL